MRFMLNEITSEIEGKSFFFSCICIVRWNTFYQMGKMGKDPRMEALEAELSRGEGLDALKSRFAEERNKDYLDQMWKRDVRQTKQVELAQDPLAKNWTPQQLENKLRFLRPRQR